MISPKTDTTLTWFVIIFWVFVLVVLPLWPTSWWYELNSVEVTDEYNDKGHRIIKVDRELKRNFVGSYKVDIQRKLPSGQYTSIQTCLSKNKINYRTDKGLPDPVTQERWKFSNCSWTGLNPEFAKGIYRDCTTVTIYPTVLPQQKVQRCSNDYEREKDSSE